MGYMKNLSISNADIWKIGDRHTENLYLGDRMRVTWLKMWGGHPAGFTAEGILRATFCKNGHTLIGELEVQSPHGKKNLACPWSKNWLNVEVL